MGWGGGVEGGSRVPKNGTQNKTPGKQRMVEMEAGGDGCACFTLILWTGMKWKREDTAEEGWFWWREEKVSGEVGVIIGHLQYSN